jgi:SAM-dependent methyltransferase
VGLLPKENLLSSYFVNYFTPQSVQARFDQETELWTTYHQESERTIVHREINLRKKIVKEQLVQFFAGQKIRLLEVGCGTGENLKEFIELDALWSGMGVDISGNMIQSCQDKFADEKRLSFSVLDIEEDVLNEVFDVIMLLGVVGYFKETKSAFVHLCSMLRPGGYILFTYGNKHSVFRMVRKVFSQWSFFKPSWFIGNILRGFMGKKRVPFKQERSFFESLDPDDVYTLIHAFGLEVVDEYGLLYSSGLFGRVSVWLSCVVEFFLKHDRFNQAFTKFLIVKKTFN